MAAVVNTSLNAVGKISPTSILLATSGDTLTYVPGANQLLVLFNTDTITATVTCDGADGTTVVLPNAGGATASVAAGGAFTIAAGSYAVIRCDTISSYLQGVVAISAAVGAKVAAIILQ